MSAEAQVTTKAKLPLNSTAPTPGFLYGKDIKVTLRLGWLAISGKDHVLIAGKRYSNYDLVPETLLEEDKRVATNRANKLKVNLKDSDGNIVSFPTIWTATKDKLTKDLKAHTNMELDLTSIVVTVEGQIMSAIQTLSDFDLNENNPILKIQSFTPNDGRIKIKLFDGERDLYIKMKEDKTFEDAMNAWSVRFGQDLKVLRFHFDGEKVEPEHTPKHLGLEDGDAIQVHLEQIGGTYGGM